jgi:hypothetical protein
MLILRWNIVLVLIKESNKVLHIQLGRILIKSSPCSKPVIVAGAEPPTPTPHQLHECVPSDTITPNNCPKCSGITQEETTQYMAANHAKGKEQDNKGGEDLEQHVAYTVWFVLSYF